MSGPLHEIPIADGERLPPAASNRSSSRRSSAADPGNYQPQAGKLQPVDSLAPADYLPQAGVFPASPAHAMTSVQTAPSWSPPEIPVVAMVPPAPGAAGVEDPLGPRPGVGQPGSDPLIVEALNAVVAAKASDLHVSANAHPMIRIDGSLRIVPGSSQWTEAMVRNAILSIMAPDRREVLELELELDFAYTLSDTARFRVNVYQQRNMLGAAFRLIPTEIKQLSSLGIPEKIAAFAQLARGLVLVTGPTGSGKSTTLAALVDLVNSTRSDHIVTVEDPIEFMHSNKRSLVNQREVGPDTKSFLNALKHVLRQDPDVILIGELRDLETISVALTAAETGHLVFATLHTQDAPQTIDRIIDVFPPHQQGQVRAQLAATLQGVVCQTLVKKAAGEGRVVATEVLIATPGVANLIREGKTYQIRSAMQAGRDHGMHTMDQHLAELVNAGTITHQAAYDKAHSLEDIKQLIQRPDPDRAATRTFANESTAATFGALDTGPDFGDSYSKRV